MKKTILMGAFCSALVLFSSCNGESKVQDVALNNQADSLSYAFGVANTDGLKNYMVTNANIDTTRMDDFIKGILEGRKEVTGKEKEIRLGMQVGSTLLGQIPQMNQMLFAGKKDRVLDEDLYFKTFLDAISGKFAMPIAAAKEYLDAQEKCIRLQQDSTFGALKTERDSLAVAFAIMNSNSVKEHLVASEKMDTTNLKNFVKGLETANSKLSESKKAFNKGVEFGEKFNAQFGDMSKMVYGVDTTKTLNKEAFFAGFLLSLQNKAVMTVEFATTYLNTTITTIKEAAILKQFAPNKKKGQEFLAKIEKKKGVTKTPSGLLYEVIKKGKGVRPTATQTVKVHYHGTLIDGTVFDSSVDRGEPIEFPLNGVIAGWTEGVQLMKEGAKYKFYIPYNLAYGTRNMGQIKPFSTLVFEVELLKVVEKK